MKYLSILIAVFFVCAISAAAQDAPPPPPLIYKAPQKSDYKEFASEDKTFKAVFPGEPKVTKQPLENGSVTNYRVYRQGSNSAISVIEFNNAAERMQKNKAKFYELMKSRVQADSTVKIEAERDVEIDGKPGKEYDALQNFERQKVRVLIAGSRIYILLSTVTNWHIIGDATKKAFADETERFFDSFKILDEK